MAESNEDLLFVLQRWNDLRPHRSDRLEEQIEALVDHHSVASIINDHNLHSDRRSQTILVQELDSVRLRRSALIAFGHRLLLAHFFLLPDSIKHQLFAQSSVDLAYLAHQTFGAPPARRLRQLVEALNALM